MKNFLKTLAGLTAILLLFSVAAHVSFADSGTSKFKTEQSYLPGGTDVLVTQYITNINEIADLCQVDDGICIEVFSLKPFDSVDLPDPLDYKMHERIGYLIPINDEKPDNRNIQLIRFEQIPLSKIVYIS